MNKKIGIATMSVLSAAACLLELTTKQIGIHCIINCLFYLILLWVSISDIRTMTIPDICHIMIFILGIFSLLLHLNEWYLYVAGFFCISIPLLLLACTTGGFGGGDIKLCAVSGLYLGAPLILLGSLCATIVAALFCIVLLLLGIAGRKDTICFGPFLALGFLFASLYGNAVMDWYILLM